MAYKEKITSIIGEYEITALLRFIEANKCHYSDFQGDIKISGLNRYGFIGFLKNKPLHLYEYKEEKETYKLLLKIKKLGQ